jgi:nitrite reductase (NADH) large subunit
MKRYLIVGNGVAGATAAEKIRDADPQGAITIITDEGQAFYSRLRLPEVMAGEKEAAAITLRSKAWYAEHGLDLRLDTEAVAINLQARAVLTKDGQSLPYDELLLAVGSRSLVPPIPGADKPGVFTLRSVADALAIGRAARETSSAVLIGGGLLGLEAATALARLGLSVKVAEYFERLLPRQLDQAGAAMLQAILEARGFEFFLGAKSRELTAKGEGLVLSLEDGRSLGGGLVLVSAGIKLNLDLARQAGLSVDKGLVVDDRMATSAEGVWAAGDLVQHRGRVYGLWPASQAQGAVAGQNMAGGQALYQGTSPSNTLKVAGVDLTSAGNIDAEGLLESAVFQDERVYRKIVLKHGKIDGLIFFGTKAGVKACQAAMDQARDVSPWARAMAGADFDFNQLLA